MGKKQHKSQATQWTSVDIRKVETWLKSSDAVKSIEEVSARSCDTVKVINDMIIIDPAKLREPYTI
jgi:hypothetical protein